MLIKTRNPSVSRDFILLFVVIMVIIALVSVWVAYKTFENYAEGVVSEMEGESIRIDRSLIVEIKGASYLLESLARQVVQIGADKPEKISRLLRSFDDNNDHRNDEFSWLNDEQEVTITSTGGVLAKPLNVSDRDYVKKALSAPWQVHMGRPIKGRVTESWALPLSLGVTDYKGNFVGIIMLSIDIEKLTEELATVVQQSGMKFSIFTPTLTLIIDSQKIGDEDIYDRGKSTPLSDIDFTKERKGMLSKPQLFQPSSPFVYYESSEQYPYVIYITYDQIANDDKIFPLLQARLIQILVIAVFLLSLLWMVRTRIIRPVERLSEITAGISAGKGYKAMPKGGPIEIENLANQIRKLSDYIAEQHRIEQELTLKNQFLMKVKETSHLITKARSDFLGFVTKELDAHVQALLPHVQDVQGQKFGAIKQSKYLDAANETAGKIWQLHCMIQDIRLIAEAEYGTFVLRESSVNISFAMHRAVRQFHQHPQHRHMEVKLKASDNLPVLIVDEDRFTQIITNLLCGAAATLTQGTPITLTAQIEQNENGMNELVLHLKYTSHAHPIVMADFSQQDLVKGEGRKEAGVPIVQTEAMCFALARMLIFLYDGELTVNATKNDIYRIFVRFPKNRLVW